MPGICGLLLCYNVGCQWIINFFKRLQEGYPYLSLPEAFDLVVAIGKFHMAAHIDECLAKHSLNFVLGAAQVDGEILETLWAPLNKSAPSTCSMSTSYCREALDWHMSNSNWQKLLGIGGYSSMSTGVI